MCLSRGLMLWGLQLSLLALSQQAHQRQYNTCSQLKRVAWLRLPMSPDWSATSPRYGNVVVRWMTVIRPNFEKALDEVWPTWPDAEKTDETTMWRKGWVPFQCCVEDAQDCHVHNEVQTSCLPSSKLRCCE